MHVDCVTCFTLICLFKVRKEKEKEKGKERKRKRKREREGEEEEEEEEEKQEEEEEDKEKEKDMCEMLFFLLLAPGSALEKFAAIVNPEDKPTKVNWTFSWPSALEICGKTVL